MPRRELALLTILALGFAVFIAFAVAFAASMLLAVLAMPFIDYRSFEIFFGSEHRWAFFVLVVIAYPFVRKRLL